LGHRHFGLLRDQPDKLTLLGRELPVSRWGVCLSGIVALERVSHRLKLQHLGEPVRVITDDIFYALVGGCCPSTATGLGGSASDLKIAGAAEAEPNTEICCRVVKAVQRKIISGIAAGFGI